jgi:hypothetical protein
LLLYLMQIKVVAKALPHDFTSHRGLCLRSWHQVVWANVAQIRLLAVAQSEAVGRIDRSDHAECNFSKMVGRARLPVRSARA